MCFMKLQISLSIIMLIFLISCAPGEKYEQEEEVIQKQNEKDIESQETRGKLTVFFFDVGQGDMTLLETPNGKYILIDCGSRTMGEGLAQLLLEQGVNKIDLIIATNPDADHIGGCIPILENIRVDMLLESELGKNTQTYKEYARIADLVTNHLYVIDDIPLEVDPSLDIQIFAAYDDVEQLSKDNEYSIVTKVTYKDTSFLFPGDCSEECEDILTNTEDLNVDILKAGHHGSRTSSGELFLAEVTPKSVIISSGDPSQYGFPHDETIERMYNAGVEEIYNTNIHGNIVLETDGKTYTIVTLNSQ